MKQLQLDFSQRRPRLRRLIGILVVVGMSMLLALMLLQYRAVDARIAEQEAVLDAAKMAMSGRTTAPSEMEQQELKMALDAQRVLNLPWESLLGALEQAQAGDKVHLLSVQPNPFKGEVALTGEAVNFDALMNYLKALRTQPVFSDVVLVNQRQVEQDGRQSLAFTLAAEWNSDIQ